MREKVASYHDHPVVQRFEAMSKEGFSFDAAPNALVSFTEPPTLMLRVPFSDYLRGRVDAAELDQFVAELRDFARQSPFTDFFAAQQPVYANVIRASEKAVTKAVTALRNYAGVPLHNCALILGLLLHHGGFAVSFERDATTEAYALIGPTGSIDDQPAFGSAADIAGIVWHEFSHTFVNPLTAAHPDAVVATTHLWKGLEARMRSQAYGSWETTISEHIVRAITTRLTYRELGQEAGEAALADEMERGFVYVAPLVERLRQYEAQREHYPTLANFYPQLLAVFEQVKE